jgi:hypothetical protein
MTGTSQTLPWWLGRGRGKDDRKQNTSASLNIIIMKEFSRAHSSKLSAKIQIENQTSQNLMLISNQLKNL